jgi:curli biogenesis system outer membrane secretion channel CsgG
MKKQHAIIVLLLLFCSWQLFAQNLSGLKKRIAVVNFEDRARYGHDIGRGVSDMLVTSLVETKKFMVIERAELDQILAEQGLGQTGLVTPQSAAKVGQLLGVEMIVTGSVTEFGEKKGDVGGGLGGLAGGLKLGISKKSARAAVDIRIVNVNTGEIAMAKSAAGEDKSTGVSQFGISDFDFHNSTSWDRTQLGKAARKAINQCVGYISDAMKGVPWQGKIIRADAATVYMKPGSKGGVTAGMTFSVYRPGEELIDPDTGISLGSEESKIGQIQVTGDVGDGRACKAMVKSGTGFQTGDLIRVK